MLEALGDEPYTGTATAIMASLNETFPNVPAGQYALARLALRSGDFELALTNARAASESNPDWIEAQLRSYGPDARLLVGRAFRAYVAAERAKSQGKEALLHTQEKIFFGKA